MGTKGTSKQQQQLPEEMIEEILCHLPVKSLFKFKCVSKRWRFLISSQRFIKRHLKKSSTYMSHHNLIVFKPGLRIKHSFRSCPLRSLIENSSFDHHPMDHIYGKISKYCDGNFEILGSCNGLILIATGKSRNLFLWNPTIRQVQKIAPHKSHDSSDPFRRFGPISFLYGFGYDEFTDDYKIVCIHLCKHYPDTTTTEMYSWRINSWKKIENFKRGFMFDSSKDIITNGKFVNGKLHWLTNYDGYRGGNHIVAFDLAKEKYEIVGRPKNHAHYQPRLHDLRGYLCLTSFDRNFGDMDVWVMTKYGDVESWVKVWTLYEQKITRLVCPLWLTIENGDIVVSYARYGGLDVVVYNESGNVLHKSRVDDEVAVKSCYDEIFAADLDGGSFDANIYFESLVSPLF